MPGSTNSPARFSSFSESCVSSSKNSRACVRFTSKRSAKCEKSSDLPILRASAMAFPLTWTRVMHDTDDPRARAEIAELFRKSPYPSLPFSPVSNTAPHLDAINWPHVKRDDRHLPQPAARTRLRDRDRVPRVHVALPENGLAGLRRDPHHVRSRCDVHRAQVAE